MSKENLENEFYENTEENIEENKGDNELSDTHAPKEAYILEDQAVPSEVSDGELGETNADESSSADTAESANCECVQSENTAEQTISEPLTAEFEVTEEDEIASDSCEEALDNEDGADAQTDDSLTQHQTDGATPAGIDALDNTDGYEVDAEDSDAPEQIEKSEDNPAVFEELISDNSQKSAETKKKRRRRSYDPENPRAIDSVFDFMELFIFSLAAVLIITTFLFKHSVVDGGSMERTLFDGEHLIISNLFYTPERGDIIVCEDYTTPLRKPIVKRVIAVEGDRVEVTSDGWVTVNGEKLDEPYRYVDFGQTVAKRPVDMIVPEGEIFVLGDHRNKSTDSRDIGTISVDSILGKVVLRFYPFESFGKVE